MKIKAYAKINLYLDVIGKRADGYHNIQTIMQEINLADDLIIKSRKDGIKIICNQEGIPTDHRNLVYQAAKLIIEYLNKKNMRKAEFTKNKGVEIKICKNIPVASGLGGGSSDAASTLVALNKLWDLQLSVRILKKLGARLGADVPFFIEGGTAYCYGRGDKVKKLKSLGSLHIILINPCFPVSTKWVYKNLKLGLTNKKKNNIMHKYTYIQKLKAKKNLYFENLEKFLYNALEPTVKKKYSPIRIIKDTLKTMGLKTVLMSGSGSTVFGIVPTQKFAEQIKEVLTEKKSYWLWVGRTRCR